MKSTMRGGHYSDLIDKFPLRRMVFTVIICQISDISIVPSLGLPIILTDAEFQSESGEIQFMYVFNRLDIIKKDQF